MRLTTACTVTLALSALLVISASAPASAADDVARGRAMALRMCATCHMNAGQGEKQGPMGVPSFEAIANRPGQTVNHLVSWLRSKPTMMPDHHLSLDEASEIAAFVMTLRRQK